ncbi:MAG: NAD(P)H-hydrate epimerase [Candidatus Omnitrophota bacterium]
MTRQKALTVKQMKQADRSAVERYGISSEVLMENAGRGAAEEIFRILKRSRRRDICIVCGVGNNGGDGFVAARQLMVLGVRPHVVLIGKPGALKQAALKNYKILRALQIPIRNVQRVTPGVLRLLQKSAVVVDAIFGIGLNRLVKEPYASMIQAMNDFGPRIISLDIPSGLDGTTGQTYGICIKAAFTITFHRSKTGLSRGEGPALCGRVLVKHIGCPERKK